MKIGMPILYEFECLEDNFKLAKKLGFDFLELNLNFSYCRKELIDYKKLKELIENYNIEITMHFFDEADFGTYDEVSNSYYILLLRYIENAVKCGLKNLTIHLNEGPIVTISGIKNYIYEKEFNEYINRLLYNVKRINDYCVLNNVKLCIENSKTVPYMLKTYDILMNEKIGFTFDIGHNELSQGLLSIIYENNKERFIINEFHIHDVKKEECTLKDHICLGEGFVNIKYYYDIAVNNNIYCLLELKSSDDLRKSIGVFKSYQ